jgi:hypothetical protein
VEQPLEGKSEVTDTDMVSCPGLDVEVIVEMSGGKLLVFTTPAVLFKKFCIFVVETQTLPARRS